MMMVSSLVLCVGLLASEPLKQGENTRKLEHGGRTRTYFVHVPPSYDGSRPVPVVVALHGAMMNGRMMMEFSGLSAKADQEGFIVVYPNGTGVGDLFLTWNAWAKPGPVPAPGEGEDARRGPADDVGFISAMLDQMEMEAKIDTRRIYVTGMSNGGMMSHRLAAELSRRIAAAAPVAGTLMVGQIKPARPVPIMHIHGTKDTFVPFAGMRRNLRARMPMRTVEETMTSWVAANSAVEKGVETTLPDLAPADGTRVKVRTHAADKGGAEVVLVTVENGGHTWPGRKAAMASLGRSTMDVAANDLIWDFFKKHALPAATASLD